VDSTRLWEHLITALGLIPIRRAAAGSGFLRPSILNRIRVIIEFILERGSAARRLSARTFERHTFAAFCGSVVSHLFLRPLLFQWGLSLRRRNTKMLKGYTSKEVALSLVHPFGYAVAGESRLDYFVRWHVDIKSSLALFLTKYYFMCKRYPFVSCKAKVYSVYLLIIILFLCSLDEVFFCLSISKSQWTH
jgi:hypothetical protein